MSKLLNLFFGRLSFKRLTFGRVTYQQTSVFMSVDHADITVEAISLGGLGIQNENSVKNRQASIAEWIFTKTFC